MAEASIPALHAELLSLQARVARTGESEVQRHQLRHEIAALRSRLEAVASGLTGLLADVYKLADQVEAAVAAPAPVPRRGDPPVRSDLLGASTYRDKGWSLMAAGDRVGAVAALREALRLAPEDAEAEVMLGWALMLDDRLDDALAAFGRVLARQPDHAMARVNLGYICLRRRIFGEAIEHLTVVLRGSEDRKATLYANYYLGLVYFDRGMFRDALPFLRQALALGPNLHEAAYDLGRALWFDGQADPAREAWRQAAAVAGPGMPWATRCAEVLATVDAGGEVPRSRPG